MKMTDKTEVSILFLGLSDAEKEECHALFRTKDLTKGELIASEGDLCQGLFIIEKGDAAAQKYTHSGEFSTLRILEAGDIFGEDQIQKEDGRYTSTLEAISDVSLSYITQSNLNNLVARFPSIREGLWKLLLQRLKLSDERVILLSQKSVRSKISYYLLRLSEKQQQTSVTLPGSREVVAKYLSIPRPSFSRELSAMEKDGIVKYSGRTVTILDDLSLRKEIGEI
ncbi:MAG: Crp/Fnr family transcriptional regulator [Clostridiales bacterium]|nr:Crp/Fnr family transcriptional regulator [Clostridiales bacterium]